MLLLIHIQDYQPRKVVQYFEVVKEKAPELVIPLRRAPRRRPGLPRHRRARARLPRLARRSSRRATWKTPRSARSSASAARRSTAIAYLLDLWREYPDTASIESDFFGLSQVLARHAGQAITDPALRRELADAGRDPVRAAPPGDPPDPGRSWRSRPGTRWPTRRAWRWSATSWSWRTSRRSSSSRRGSPGSTPRARSSTASSTARRWATSTSASTTAPSRSPRRSPRPPTRTPTASTSRARTSGRRSTSSARSTTPAASPAKALGYYEQVADRFTDAAGAVKSYTRKDLKLPEVSVVRPGARAGDAGEVGLRPIAPSRRRRRTSPA